jgi:DNA anti-recombination protein RmuC
MENSSLDWNLVIAGVTLFISLFSAVSAMFAYFFRRLKEQISGIDQKLDREVARLDAQILANTARTDAMNARSDNLSLQIIELIKSIKQS